MSWLPKRDKLDPLQASMGPAGGFILDHGDGIIDQ